MRLMFRSGGSLETFSGYDSICVYYVCGLWHRRQGYWPGAPYLRPKSFCRVHDNRTSARLGAVLSSALIRLIVGNVMGLTETEALVLRTYNLAEADKIVVCLTRTAGLVR